MKVEELKNEADELLDVINDKEELLHSICEFLEVRIDHYNWVGFYLVEDGRLKLGPYVGEPTEHTDIDFGEGVCGQAAESEDTFVIEDVSEEDNYLACSPKVRSEIVVPIFKEGEVAGELDIDSHQKDAFSDEDEQLLYHICEKLEKRI